MENLHQIPAALLDFSYTNYKDLEGNVTTEKISGRGFRKPLLYPLLSYRGEEGK
jgi:hypothetical protein